MQRDASAQPSESDSFLGVLRTLTENEVEFILVGGLAIYLHGVPFPTEDVDVLYARSEKNLLRLARALDDLEARYRDPAGRLIEPTVERLAQLRMNLLRTRLGAVDALQVIGDGLDFETLLPRSEVYEIEGLRVRILGLEAIIESKEHADRPKDRLVLPFLREALDEKRRRDADDS